MKTSIKTSVLSFAFLCLLPFQAVAAEETPKQVVASTIQAIIDVLEERTDKTSITDLDREGIRNVVAGKFDYKEMSRRSVGKPWKEMEEDKQIEFIDLFRQMLEYSYGNQLSGYHGQKVVFEDAEFRKDKARVKGEVIDSSKSIPMEYRLHQTAIGWQVYDIKIEGVSMIITFRRDFKSIIKEQGVDGLMATLKTKVNKLKAKG
jgi:phospholipid transport system substrate-binding protein